MSSSFIFTTCQVGAESALKQEIAREHPKLKFSYSRPGFVTFKNSEREMGPDFELHSVFARSFGLCFGKIGNKDSTTEELTKEAYAFLEKSCDPDTAIVHVIERDQHAPDEEPKGFQGGLWENFANASFERLYPSLKLNIAPSPGSSVVTVLLVDEKEWWIGFHTHSPAHSPIPGGKAKIKLPERAPSRAYLKMKESLLWSGAPIRGGEIALELGSAPGGSCFALLEHGLEVFGVDPAAMDPVILRNPKFHHISLAVSALTPEDLPPGIDWFALDMNVSPDVSLPMIEKIIPSFSNSLQGVLLTFKLNNWRYAESIPALMERLKALGLARLKATQLSSNRQEIFVYGLTRLGLRRN